MNSIEQAIKAFLNSYIIENGLQDRVSQDGSKFRDSINLYKDSIDTLMQLMYDSLAEKRGLLIQNKSIDYAYPSVIRAVKFIKNLQHHRFVGVPTDYRTNVQAYGNLFTLSSILILVFHAYVEMLEVWLETINNYKKS
jgi:hypothetical protein